MATGKRVPITEPDLTQWVRGYYDKKGMWPLADREIIAGDPMKRQWRTAEEWLKRTKGMTLIDFIRALPPKPPKPPPTREIALGYIRRYVREYGEIPRRMNERIGYDGEMRTWGDLDTIFGQGFCVQEGRRAQRSVWSR